MYASTKKGNQIFLLLNPKSYFCCTEIKQIVKEVENMIQKEVIIKMVVVEDQKYQVSEVIGKALLDDQDQVFTRILPIIILKVF